MEAKKNIVLLIALSSLLFSFSAQAICVTRNHNHVIPRFSPVPKISVPSTTPEVAAPKANNPPPKAPASPRPAAPKAPAVEPKVSVAAPKAPAVEPKVSVAAPKAPAVAPKAPVAAPKASAPTLKAATTNNAELNRLCGLTENPTICVEAIAPYLKDSKDSKSILKAAMTAANVTLGAAISEAKKFSSDPKTAPKVKTCITACVESFESAVDDIEKSFKAVDREDVGSLDSNLDGALTMVGTCEDTFDENPGVESPMQETENKLSLLIGNCLAIRNEVKKTMNPSPPVVVW